MQAIKAWQTVKNYQACGQSALIVGLQTIYVVTIGNKTPAIVTRPQFRIGRGYYYYNDLVSYVGVAVGDYELWPIVTTTEASHPGLQNIYTQRAT